jgi:hypothetical protein
MPRKIEEKRLAKNTLLNKVKKTPLNNVKKKTLLNNQVVRTRR